MDTSGLDGGEEVVLRLSLDGVCRVVPCECRVEFRNPHGVRSPPQYCSHAFPSMLELETNEYFHLVAHETLEPDEYTASSSQAERKLNITLAMPKRNITYFKHDDQSLTIWRG